MSDAMPGNPHYGEDAPDFAATLDGREVTGALLALAYEQRTANLIAFLGDGQFSEASLIHKEIVKRLGLNEWAVAQ